VSNQEKQFDAATEIESALIRNGYSRNRFVDGKYVEMPLNGDTSYYFSSMNDIAFYYKKGDTVFTVGIHEAKHPPQLYNCNKEIKFSKFKVPANRLHRTAMSEIDKMLAEVGCDEFIRLVENGETVPFCPTLFVLDKKTGVYKMI